MKILILRCLLLMYCFWAWYFVFKVVEYFRNLIGG